MAASQAGVLQSALPCVRHTGGSRLSRWLRVYCVPSCNWGTTTASYIVGTWCGMLCRFAYSSMIMHGTLSSVAVGSGRAASALGHGANTCPDTWLGPLLRDVEEHATGPVCIFLHGMKDTIAGRSTRAQGTHNYLRAQRLGSWGCCNCSPTTATPSLVHGRPGTDCGDMTTRSQRCGA